MNKIYQRQAALAAPQRNAHRIEELNEQIQTLKDAEELIIRLADELRAACVVINEAGLSFDADTTAEFALETIQGLRFIGLEIEADRDAAETQRRKDEELGIL
jgi:hypothetical protein